MENIRPCLAWRCPPALAVQHCCQGARAAPKGMFPPVARARRLVTDGSWSIWLHLIHKSPRHKVKTQFLPLKHTGQNSLDYTKFINLCLTLIQNFNHSHKISPDVIQHLHLGPDLKSMLLFRLHYRSFTGLNWKNISFQLWLALRVPTSRVITLGEKFQLCRLARD